MGQIILKNVDHIKRDIRYSINNSPFNTVFLFRVGMPFIIRRVKIAARRADGLVSQVIADMPQIHIVVCHMRSRRMPQPVGRSLHHAIGMGFECRAA